MMVRTVLVAICVFAPAMAQSAELLTFQVEHYLDQHPEAIEKATGKQLEKNFTNDLDLRKQKKTADLAFWFSGVVLVGSTIADVETTFSFKKQCERTPGCNFSEQNPLQRPLVSSGRFATYAAHGVFDALVMGATYKLKKNNNNSNWMLIVPLGVSGGHGVGIAVTVGSMHRYEVK